jgi:class 3 adenylate cyclase
LEARVTAPVEELGRLGRLKRFLAPQLAEMIIAKGLERILESHRREIVVVCDLRGYTAFTETAEPEDVLDFLREYHGALGPLVSQFEGTLDQFSGDGIMVFFNDPVSLSRSDRARRQDGDGDARGGGQADRCLAAPPLAEIAATCAANQPGRQRPVPDRRDPLADPRTARPTGGSGGIGTTAGSSSRSIARSKRSRKSC